MNEPRIKVLRHSDDATDHEYGSVFQHNQRMLMVVVGNEFFDPHTGAVVPPADPTLSVEELIADAVIDYQREHPRNPVNQERMLEQAHGIISESLGPSAVNPSPQKAESWLERYKLLEPPKPSES